MDWWIVGSGPSLDFIDPHFFEGKHVVAVNNVAERLRLYDFMDPDHLLVHTHYHRDAIELATAHPRHMVYAPEGDEGFAGQPSVRMKNITYYPHPAERQFDFDVEKAWSPGGLVVGSTSTHGAMHLACWMGATTLICVGLDCGRIDGAANHTGYVSGNLETADDPDDWLRRWDGHLRQVKAWLTRQYGVRVYSLNPFVNLNLEGHSFTG